MFAANVLYSNGWNTCCTAELQKKQVELRDNFKGMFLVICIIGYCL